MRLALAIVLAFALAVVAGGIVLGVGRDAERDAYYAWCESAGGVAWNSGGLDICTVGELPDDAVIDGMIDRVDGED
jgi:hypothetical protein